MGIEIELTEIYDVGGETTIGFNHFIESHLQAFKLGQIMGCSVRDFEKLRSQYSVGGVDNGYKEKQGSDYNDDDVPY